jgi:dipeptidyl aminopeptidase/acylaminoacyl peptidase
MVRCSLFFLLGFGLSPTFGQERTRTITPEDYFSLNTVTEVVISPKGNSAALIEARWDTADDSRKSDLWLLKVGSSQPERLTFDRANDRHPIWDANGDAIYFLGNRKREGDKQPPWDGSTQVWCVKANGAELRPITRVPGGVTGFAVPSRTNSLFFSKDVEFRDQDDFANLRSKFNRVEYGHGVRHISEIHRLDLRSWKTEKVVDEKRYIREFVVTQDAKRIAMITAFDDTVVKSEGESRVDVLEDGKVVTPPTEVYRKTAASPYAWLEGLAWSPAGDQFSFAAVFDAFPAEIVIGSYSASGWTTEYLKREKEFQIRGYGSPSKWLDKELHYLGESSGRVSRAVYQPGEKSKTKELPEEVIYGFDAVRLYSTATPQTKSVAIRATPTEFARVVFEGETTVYDPNPHTKTWKLPSVQHITWKAPDGTEVGGILELPYGYKKGDKLPLVVAIHGGPTTSTKTDVSFDPHNGRLYFTARGYAVLLPNYRGSTGYGDKFVTDLIGTENDIEVKDILAGIQHLVKEGIVDSNRVGVMGWSNGGYLTNCLITLKNPPINFKAASSGAGILDTVAEWGFNDEPAYPIVFKKGLPWQQPELYKKTSPTYGLGNVTTPTLIHVGGNDERCPPGHSRMLYRALKEYQKIPTELVVYTGEPHGLSKLSNRKAKMEWDLAWFDKWMK